MSVIKKEMIYEGKAKRIFTTDADDVLIMEFKDSLTAFNAQKKGNFEGKGSLNCKISTLIFKELRENGVNHHWISTDGENLMTVQKTRIIPLEVVVRNYMAGSFAKKLNRKEGEKLRLPVVEYYFKEDSLNDPFVNEDQVICMGWATAEQLSHLKQEALRINSVLSNLMAKAKMKLVDFKVEFGVNSKGQVILADEISPDCMRLWDEETNKKLDKDRFRQDLGSVDEAYKEVYVRIQTGRAQ